MLVRLLLLDLQVNHLLRLDSCCKHWSKDNPKQMYCHG